MYLKNVAGQVWAGDNFQARKLFLIGVNMKIYIAIFGLFIFAAGTSQASAATPQVNDLLRAERKLEKRMRHKIRHRNDRSYYETVTVWHGNKEYEDTYRVTIKNGNRHEKRVSHRRIN
jgi:hypothetical protein